MKVTNTKFAGLFIIEPNIFKDKRGFFYESYNKKKLDKLILSDENFVQDNHSYSNKGVIRGLHFQIPPYGQIKLIRVLKGKIFDVVIDLRKSSKTFKKYFTIELSDQNRKQLYIPEGFAHGFQSLSDGAEVLYKVSKYYSPTHERHINFEDQFLKKIWPIKKTYTSSKDNVDAPLESSFFFNE